MTRGKVIAIGAGGLALMASAAFMLDRAERDRLGHDFLILDKLGYKLQSNQRFDEIDAAVCLATQGRIWDFVASAKSSLLPNRRELGRLAADLIRERLPCPEETGDPKEHLMKRFEKLHLR